MSTAEQQLRRMLSTARFDRRDDWTGDVEEVRPLEKGWRRPEDSFPGSRAVVRGCGRYELMIQPAPHSSGFVVSGSMFSVNRPGHQQSGSLGSRWFANEQDARKAANAELRRLCRRPT